MRILIVGARRKLAAAHRRRLEQAEYAVDLADAGAHVSVVVIHAPSNVRWIQGSRCWRHAQAAAPDQRRSSCASSPTLHALGLVCPPLGHWQSGGLGRARSITRAAADQGLLGEGNLTQALRGP